MSRLKYISEGGIAMSCTENNNVNIKELCASIKEKLGSDYEVQVPEKKNPRLIIYNIDKGLIDDENIVEKIIIQNRVSTSSEERILKLLHKFQTKKGATNIVIESDPKTYKDLKQNNKISIGWKASFYRDYVNVIQCYRCWKFGHMSKECKSGKEVCPKCTK